MFSLKQKRKAFGLDISDLSIKIVELRRTAGSYRTVAYTDRPLPRGIMVNDVIMNEEHFISNLKEIMVKLDFGSLDTDYVVASIPEPKAFVRVFQIPKISEDKAATVIPYEAEQYIPISLDQAYLDWEILGESDDKLDVLVTASPKSYIDAILNAFKRAGLRPVAFEIESAACARSLIPRNKKDKTVLILDMDAFRTSLIVVEKGHLQFTSSIPISGEAFTQSIASGLGVSAKEAEKIKREFGLDDSKEHQNLKNYLMPVLDSLVAEIRNIIKFHEEHFGTSINEIILCGGSAKLLHLSSSLYQKLVDYGNIDIILGNPWINIFDAAHKNDTNLSREDSLSFTTAIGLAMRGAGIYD